jgi:outer membrane biosynthesis protein TonB
MRLPAKIVTWLLPLFLTGCWFHRNQKPPVAPTAPKIDANSSALPPTQPPPPEVYIPTKPQVSETKLPYQQVKPPAKRKKQPAAPAVPAPETQTASSGQPAVSAIGQLSSGDPAGARSQTENSLNEIERVLNGITRQFSSQEQATAAHIREYLKQAREALKSGDVDGASTLAAKAKVLLQELSR